MERDVLLHVTEVRHVRDHVLWLSFDDGAQGTVDLAHELDGPVFEPLRDVSFFSRVFLDPEFKVTAWPNGADLAPEFLRDLLVEQSVG